MFNKSKIKKTRNITCAIVTIFTTQHKLNISTITANIWQPGLTCSSIKRKNLRKREDVFISFFLRVKKKVSFAMKGLHPLKQSSKLFITNLQDLRFLSYLQPGYCLDYIFYSFFYFGFFCMILFGCDMIADFFLFEEFLSP